MTGAAPTDVPCTKREDVSEQTSAGANVCEQSNEAGDVRATVHSLYPTLLPFSKTHARCFASSQGDSHTTRARRRRGLGWNDEAINIHGRDAVPLMSDVHVYGCS